VQSLIRHYARKEKAKWPSNSNMFKVNTPLYFMLLACFEGGEGGGEGYREVGAFSILFRAPTFIFVLVPCGF
jgi:hypothetical protein